MEERSYCVSCHTECEEYGGNTRERPGYGARSWLKGLKMICCILSNELQEEVSFGAWNIKNDREEMCDLRRVETERERRCEGN